MASNAKVVNIGSALPTTPQAYTASAFSQKLVPNKANAPQMSVQPSIPSNILTPQKYAQLSNAQEVAAANVVPLPPSITVTVASSTGGSNVRCYIFNQDVFSTTTNNGSGAGSVVTTYQDGFTGAVVNRLLGLARNGVGAICYGVAVRMVVTSSKAGDPTGLGASNPRFDIYNPLGSSIPTNFNVTSDQTRKDYDTSIEVMNVVQNISYLCQFSIIVPTGDTATVTFYFDPRFAS